MRILVTGGAGFIGSWLVESLIKAGHTITVIDNLSPQIHGHLPSMDVSWLNKDSGVNFIRADIRDLKVMDQALANNDAVVHLAAETGTGQSMYQVAHYYDVNQQATAAMFEAITTRHKHIQQVVLASSRSIYGEGAYLLNGQLFTPSSRDAKHLHAGQFEPAGPNGERLELIATPESTAAMPASVYAATKLANETLGRLMAEAYGLQVTALRFQNVYGERQSLKNPYTGLLSIFSNRMRQNLPINIFEDGKESRDFVHVSDVVQAIALTLQEKPRGFQAINIGSGVATSVMDVARQLRSLLSSTSELKISGDFRAGDIRHCYADLSQARKNIKFTPRIDLETGLSRFVSWVGTQAIAEDKSEAAMAELSKLGLGRPAK